MRFLKLGLLVAGVAGLCTAGYFAQHFYDYFPDDKNASLHFTRGEDEFNRADFAKAIAEYKLAAGYSPKRTDIRRRLSVALFNDRRPNEALVETETAYQLEPSNVDIRKEYSVVLELNGRDADAAKIVESLLKEQPNNDELKFRLAEIYHKASNFSAAKALYEEYAKLHPTQNGAWLAIAHIQGRDGSRKASIATLRRALEYSPSDALLHQELGAALAQDGQKEASIAEFKIAAAVDPNAIPTSANLIKAVQRTTREREFVVPLRKVGNDYVVDALLDGRFRARLAIDANIKTVAVSQDLATRMQMFKGIGSTRPSIPSVRVGKAVESSVPSSVIPQKIKYDGLLGAAFLQRYDYNIDAKRNLLILKQR